MTMSEIHTLSGRAEPNAGGTVRAYWLAQGAEFIRHHFEIETRSRLEQNFSSDLNQALAERSLGDWVARTHLVELFEATSNARGRAETVTDLVACGEFIAQRANNRFTQLLTQILTPALLIRKLPLFWRRDYGLSGTCVVDACAPGSARFHLESVGDFPHIGAVWLGWVRASLATVHAHSIEAKQSGYSAASPCPARVDFEVTWS